ncbi:ABC transporter permease [Sphaerisporangium fuscum]|uniref:ABC transporter permease n=1 Tax=Sphaerisporangium fuscum TaxID=2835868 RepID=UPI001BDCEB11|nr:ABC transporter permease [Sphaerisporangium fuscum]
MSRPSSRAAGRAGGGLSAFRAALRISRRDAWRAKGRSALVLVMIGLPVLVITALVTLINTFDLTPAESLSRELGTADARLIVPSGPRRAVGQDPGGINWETKHKAPPLAGTPWSTAEIVRLLPPGSRAIPIWTGSRSYSGKWLNPTPVTELDVRDPLTRGMIYLRRGRLPKTPDEVLVSGWLARHGVGVGATLSLSPSPVAYRVVGVADDLNRLNRDLVIALPDERADRTATQWLVDTPAPLTWADLDRLNAQGVVMRSRSIISGQPYPHSRLDNYVWRKPSDQLVVSGLLVTMIVLEVVLLAGPAFAVGLRRRRRELALIGAQGASARHLRSIVLADGLVLGGCAVVLGVVGGLAAAWAAVPPVEAYNGSVAGPYDVPVPEVAAVACLGLLSAVLAAVVPALQAGRTDLVRALAGLRGEPKPRRGWPLAGLALLVLGIALITIRRWAGPPLRWRLDTNVALTGGLLLEMLGVVLLTPWLIGVAGGLVARLPLPFRLAARDATRNRGRTAPAVAAVSATVAALMMMLIIWHSGDARAAAGYRPSEAYGALTVDASRALDQNQAARLRGVVQPELPGVPLTEVYRPAYPGGDRYSVQMRSATCRQKPHSDSCEREMWTGVLNDIQMGGPDLLRYLTGRDDSAAAAALAAGKAVVFLPDVVTGGRATLTITGNEAKDRVVDVPAIETSPARPDTVGALLPMRLATDLGLKPQLYRLVVDPERHTVTPAEEERVADALQTMAPDVGVQVERGYRSVYPLVELFVTVGAILLALGGTFAATGLAVADARPDMSTLGAVGAAPGVRRLVTFGQAWFIAGIGVATGIVAGFVPGASEALASSQRVPGPWTPEGVSTPVLVVPWATVVLLVVVFPLVAGLVAALFARTRITLARRMT